jgi:hypothetical protein
MSLANKLKTIGRRAINTVGTAYDFARGKVTYYLSSPEQRAMIRRVQEARKSGRLKQMTPIKPYSDTYWKIKDADARREE